MIQGIDALRRNLRRLADQTAPQIAEAAANAAAARLARGAQRRAPHDSGRLAAGIRPLAAKVRGRRARAGIISDAPGAAAQEFGTHTTPAQPHMRTAEFEDRAPILEAAGNAARNLVR